MLIIMRVVGQNEVHVKRMSAWFEYHFSLPSDFVFR